jgi:hypothetical protein
MDLFLNHLRAAYSEHPAFIIIAAVALLSVGIVVGYRLVGPALFG